MDDEEIKDELEEGDVPLKRQPLAEDDLGIEPEEDEIEGEGDEEGSLVDEEEDEY